MQVRALVLVILTLMASCSSIKKKYPVKHSNLKKMQAYYDELFRQNGMEAFQFTFILSSNEKKNRMVRGQHWIYVPALPANQKIIHFANESYLSCREFFNGRLDFEEVYFDHYLPTLALSIEILDFYVHTAFAKEEIFLGMAHKLAAALLKSYNPEIYGSENFYQTLKRISENSNRDEKTALPFLVEKEDEAATLLQALINI